MELYIEEIYAAKKRRGAKGNSRSVGVRSIERFYRLIILLAIRKMKKKNREEGEKKDSEKGWNSFRNIIMIYAQIKIQRELIHVIILHSTSRANPTKTLKKSEKSVKGPSQPSMKA